MARKKKEPETPQIPGLIALIKERFQRAENDKMSVEQRMLRAYRSYRGVYGPEVVFTDPSQSKIFIKVTKTKVVAAFGQVIDVLFGTEKFPITIEPTDQPLGIAEFAHANLGPQQAAPPPPDPYGFEGDGRAMLPGASEASPLGGLDSVKAYQGVEWQAGPADDKMKQIQISPAEEAARNMQKVIWDQLDESHATTALRTAVFEMVLLGTGVIKGPFNYTKTYHNWTKGEEGTERQYNPEQKEMPKIEAVSVWNLYPDPAATGIHNAAWVIERHKLTPSQVRDLANRPRFNIDAIRKVLSQAPNYLKRSYEDQLRPLDQNNTEGTRYEVLEYWGTADLRFLQEIGMVDIKAKDVDVMNEVQINAWVCGNELLRVVINPFTPNRIPYLACPYEIDPYNFWGVALPENMEDSQQMMNGHARMAVDNLKLAGHVILDVDDNMLVAGQDMKITPGKIFRRQGGQPGQAVFGIKLPSTAQDNMLIFDKFRQIADEETGIPSYSHGSTGIMSTGRTASGMSMLMSAAALNIKTVIKNLDDFLLRPLGEAMFQWNMQFNEDDLDIRGDLEVRARGTSSLMQKEVRSQRLMMLMNTASNPQLAPFLKWHTVLEELAHSLDIDPEKIIANPEEAALYAQIVGMQNVTRNGEEAAAAGQPPTMAPSGGASGGTNPQDTQGSGGGTVGTGSVPKPGEGGFSAANNPTAGKGAGKPK